MTARYPSSIWEPYEPEQTLRGQTPAEQRAAIAMFAFRRLLVDYAGVYPDDVSLLMPPWENMLEAARRQTRREELVENPAA